MANNGVNKGLRGHEETTTVKIKLTRNTLARLSHYELSIGVAPGTVVENAIKEYLSARGQ
jgi:hypothetical protein